MEKAAEEKLAFEKAAEAELAKEKVIKVPIFSSI